ncbi:DUF2141 domain-containing protein [uncultured Tenacibaculum sp.]|uniref:DUF2141 domain-containing protein n=1 Tax=uncultured Tenacibaculum sp. TaxID=174713 RepID=UPI002609561B|nr:DUF2141 domain-containing protein [uncultured Tenacibaculum sp.]
MKFLSTILFALLTFNSVLAQKGNQKITVTVINATSSEGTVKFALSDKENFLIGKPIQAKEAKIENGKSVVVFENVPAGEYAITCFHDKNSNGKMDFQPSGMPMEDYGASNNVMNFGPPRYDDAKFTITNKDVSLDIKF